MCPNEGFRLQMAIFEVQELGYSTVADDAGADWEFFEWNKLVLFFITFIYCYYSYFIVI